MNNKLNQLQPYPFAKMADLLAKVTPNSALKPIKLSIGEPKHTPPEFVLAVVKQNLDKIQNYPTTNGLPELREAMATWLTKRFNLQGVNADNQVLPVMGTREAIFSFTQAAINTLDTLATPANHATTNGQQPTVVMPNPFYQIYEGATLLAGAKPYFVNCDTNNHYAGDYSSVPTEVWQNTQLVFVCSPNNPTGAVMSEQALTELIKLSDQYGFIIASDECYSELYFDTPPVGLLEVCAKLGRHDFKNCVVFHSLSKRSNLPGMRSGFIAGDANLITPYLQYRTYHGCAMPIHHQLASIAAWQDESHVEANRQAYRAKFDLWLTELGDKLPLKKPDAGFYFWLPVENDEEFVLDLYKDLNIHALAGRYLSRDTPAGNAGLNHVRLALVADLAQSEAAVKRIKGWL